MSDNEPGDWTADLDPDLVTSKAKDLIETVVFAQEKPVEQLHAGLAHVLAGFFLLKGLNVYRHAARRHIEHYFNSIFGRLN